MNILSFKEIFSEKRRQDNKYVSILSTIWQKPGISRKDICTELSLSNGTVSKNINYMLERNWIVENGYVAAAGSTGRRQVSLTLKSDLFYSIGVCLYQGFYRAVLLDASTSVLQEIVLDWNRKKDYQERFVDLKDAINKLLAAVDKKKVLGIGIAIPGFFDNKSGKVYFSSEAAEGFSFTDFIEKNFDLPFRVINISQIRAVMEYMWGAAKGMKNFIIIDSGFGAGFFFNGKLCRGWQGQSGEFGHMQIQRDGEFHTDGRPGTIEVLAALYKIMDKVAEIIRQGGMTKMKKYMVNVDKPSVEMIIMAIEDGDLLCAQLLSESFEHVACGIVNIAYLLNPEAIFLEDWTARCPSCTIDIVRRRMGHYGVSNSHLSTKILSASCNKDMVAKGSAYMLADAFLGNVFIE